MAEVKITDMMTSDAARLLQLMREPAVTAEPEPPHGSCAVCGRILRLTLTGGVRWHRDRAVWPSQRCEGAGKAPARSEP